MTTKEQRHMLLQSEDVCMDATVGEEAGRPEVEGRERKGTATRGFTSGLCSCQANGNMFSTWRKKQKSKNVVPACSQNHCLVPGTFESAFPPIIHVPNSLTIALSNPVLSQTWLIWHLLIFFIDSTSKGFSIHYLTWDPQQLLRRMNGSSHHLCFTDEKTEAQKSMNFCSWAHTELV